VPGWLDRPSFGLEPGEFTRLAAEVDLVIHCGEQAEPLRSYADLRAANVLGTLEAVQLAMQGGAALCLVSTIDVVSARVPSSGSVDAAPTETATLDRPEALPTPYAQTKWVAEEIVREAQRRGLRGSIVRPGALLGSRELGAMPPGSVMGAMIAGLVELGACFAAEFFELPQLCAVDEAARGIVRLAFEDARLGAPRVHHLVHPRPIALAQLAEWIRGFGYPLHEIDYAAWRELAFARPQQNRLQPFETLLDRAVEGKLFARVDCAATTAALAALGLRWSPLDAEHVHAVLRAFVARGVIGAPPPGARALSADADRRC
jgi:thioester reductase-like protein